MMEPGGRKEPVEGRLLPGVVNTGESTVISTCDVTEPCDDIRFRPAGPEVELLFPVGVAAAAVCLGELTVGGDMILNGVVGE